MRPWPGNDLARLTDDDRILHDHLCELLSDRMNEADVCTASVGIWGALSLMRDKMNVLHSDFEARGTTIKELREAQERGQQLSADFNKLAKERDTIRAELEKLKTSPSGKNIEARERNGS